jgi:hypothetical protein
MKKSFLSWSLCALAAALGLDVRTMADETAFESEGAPIVSARESEDSETHGLLASRFSTFTSPASTNSAAKARNLPPSAPYQMAAWDTMANSSGGPAQVPDSSLACGTCDACDCCPDPLWMHRTGAFFDLLIIRPGNIDYVYAVEQTGTLPTDSPTGPTGRVGFDTAPGYRLGTTFALSDCTSIQASYTWFNTGTNDQIAASAGNFLIFQPSVPNIPNVGAANAQAAARYDIQFQQLDIDYRGLLYGTCDSAVNYFAGLRYANLEQRFGAQENVGVPVGLRTVNTDIDFDGFGIGFGLDAMKRSAYSGLLIYGKASSSFVAGEFKGDLRQTSQFGPNSIVGNSIVDYRVMTILQTELGIGWQSGCGRFRVQTGYQFAGWFNALTTGTYISGVQNRTFDNLWETVTFDGFTGRLEWRF